MMSYTICRIDMEDITQYNAEVRCLACGYVEFLPKLQKFWECPKCRANYGKVHNSTKDGD